MKKLLLLTLLPALASAQSIIFIDDDYKAFCGTSICGEFTAKQPCLDFIAPLKLDDSDHTYKCRQETYAEFVPADPPPDPDPDPDPNPQLTTVFSWDVESAALGHIRSSPNPFSETDWDANVSITNEYSFSGSKSIKIEYHRDEDGGFLYVPPFGPAKEIVIEMAEYYEGFDGNWPKGLKIARVSEKSNFQPPYTSHKWYTAYSPGNEYGYQINNAIGDHDIVVDLAEPIRDGVWYEIKIRQVMNSGDGVEDGIMQQWINGDLVLDLHNVAYWDSSNNRAGSGVGWGYLWFGGNYSNSGVDPNPVAKRYIDDLKVFIGN